MDLLAGTSGLDCAYFLTFSIGLLWAIVVVATGGLGGDVDVPDADVAPYLKIYTGLGREEIEAILAERVAYAARSLEAKSVFADSAAAHDLLPVAGMYLAEYVAACRKAGLTVGFYYSLMSWRWRGYWFGANRY